MINLKESRIIRVALIGVISLLILWLMSYSLILILIILISKTIDENKIEAYIKIIEIMKIPVAGSIATIVTAVIARYGLREATKNIKGGDHE